MANQTVRQELATFLESIAPAGVQVYSSPDDLVKAPAMVVNPSDPYAIPSDLGGPLSVLWAFDVVLVTSRVKVDESLAMLENLAAVIWSNLSNHANARWVDFGELGTTEIGEVPMLTATIAIAVVDQITTA